MPKTTREIIEEYLVDYEKYDFHKQSNLKIKWYSEEEVDLWHEL